MNPSLLVAGTLTAVLDWFAVAKHWRPVEFIAKPAVMLILLAWLLTSLRIFAAPVWFAAGVFFSLLGDVFLLLPRRWFLPGLLAFLSAHLAYIVGFNQTLPTITVTGVVLALLVAILAWQIYRRLSASIRRKDPRMEKPVLVYSVVISLMLVSALWTLFKAGWLHSAAGLVSLGALLFFLSDSLLAWNRFVSTLRLGRLPEMIAYHLGQILIVAGVILQYR